MTSEQAHEINRACIRNGLRRFGLTAESPSLRPYTLRQLIDARDIVAAENRETEKQPGPHRITMICDDRLLAALYVAYHYDPCEPDRRSGQIEPLAVSNEGVAVVTLQAPPQPVDLDDDDHCGDDGQETWNPRASPLQYLAATAPAC